MRNGTDFYHDMGNLWGTCCVVDEFCTSPANVDPPVRLRRKCYSCGDFVCRMCSSMRNYYSYGKQRLCNTCQTQYDGNDLKVIERLHQLGAPTRQYSEHGKDAEKVQTP